jgi:Hemingway/CFA97
MKKGFQSPNKILKKIEDIRENQRLYNEIVSIRPTMNFPLPLDYSHLKVNRKKEQAKEGKVHADRYTEIERENRLLLEKIHNINSKTQHLNEPRFKQSLNISLRAKNLRQISIDNMNFLKRLQSKSSDYGFNRLELGRNRDLRKARDLNVYNSFARIDYAGVSKSQKPSPVSFKVKETVFKNNAILGGKRVYERSVEPTKKSLFYLQV